MYSPGTNTGHGHVWERPDGVKARCGGPRLCSVCAMDWHDKVNGLLKSNQASKLWTQDVPFGDHSTVMGEGEVKTEYEPVAIDKSDIIGAAIESKTIPSSLSETPFPVRLRSAAIVPRWSITWTLKEDYVAGHSFFVAIYAFQIARLIGWPGPYDQLLLKALIHDLDETITGDIVGVVKREIIDASKTSKFIKAKMLEQMPAIDDLNTEIAHNNFLHSISLIIKAADQLEALLFMLTEKVLGNGIIGERVHSGIERLEITWRSMEAIEGITADKLKQLWYKVIIRTIADHSDPRLYDI